MAHHDRNALKLNAMRRNIAALAARLMAEDGIADYGLAKRKAARQLGAPETEALPKTPATEPAPEALSPQQEEPLPAESSANEEEIDIPIKDLR